MSLTKSRRDFSAGDLFGAIHTFKRMRTIMKTLVAQIDILETMTPSSFSSFRDRLETASGFQSVQFREVRVRLGYKRASTVKYLKPDYPGAIGCKSGSMNARWWIISMIFLRREAHRSRLN